MVDASGPPEFLDEGAVPGGVGEDAGRVEGLPWGGRNSRVTRPASGNWKCRVVLGLGRLFSLWVAGVDPSARYAG